MSHLSRRSVLIKSKAVLLTSSKIAQKPSFLHNYNQKHSFSVLNHNRHNCLHKHHQSPSLHSHIQHNSNPLHKHSAYQYASSNEQKTDYYDMLGVSRDCEVSEIKKAFYKLAKQWHPDANPAPEAQGKFSEINEAYQVLSNKDKRAQYDRFGHGGMPGGMDASGFQNMGDFNLNDLFENLFGGKGGGGFSPFGDTFGNAQQSNDPNAPQKGRDLQLDVHLSFMEAVKGCKRDLQLQRFDICKTCDSSGNEPGTTPSKCKSCNGHGRMTQNSGFMIIQQTCWDCNGSGQKAENCKECHGSGLKHNTTTLDVNIPAGVDDGTRVRISGQGHHGKNHGGRGSAWLMCKVKEDSQFERNGSDVHVAIEVPVYTAILGGTVSVPTLNGEAEVKVKPGTQPDHREIMRGKGIREPSTGRTGNQYLHFNVSIPMDINDEQRELIQKFADICDGSKK